MRARKNISVNREVQAGDATTITTTKINEKVRTVFTTGGGRLRHHDEAMCETVLAVSL